MSIESFFKLGMKRNIISPIDDYDPTKHLVLNLGPGNSPIQGAVNLDLPEWDADKDGISFADNTVDQIHAYHFFEHVKDPSKLLLECRRVLKYGGHINIIVPYYNSQMSAQDLDHKHVFCEETWRVLFSTEYYNKNKIEGKFIIGTNIIIGIVERNLTLMTQLIKR